MSYVAYLAAAYAAMIGLIGWFTWQLLDRLKDVQSRIEAVEESISNPEDSEDYSRRLQIQTAPPAIHV